MVLAAADAIPADWEGSWRNDAMWLWQLPEPFLPPPEHVEKLKAAGPPVEGARALALELHDLPHGHYPVEFPPDRFDMFGSHLGKAMNAANLLEYDAAVAVLLDRDPNRAIRAAHATLNVARSIGDEPTLGSQYIRMLLGGQAARIAMQTLAWGEPTEGLAELEAELLKEADAPLFLYAMRGHRANMHRLFLGLEAGRFTYGDVFTRFESHKPALARPDVFRAYRPLLPADHAEALRRLTAGVAVAKRPPHEQLAAAYALRAAHSDDFRYQITRQFVYNIDSTATNALTSRAALETAAVGIACERFRIARGRWPHDLSDLVPAVPLSPFDARPLRYKVGGDRVAISCRAEHHWLHQAARQEFDDPDTTGLTVGVQLWLPRSRALPPKPKEPEPEQP